MRLSRKIFIAAPVFATILTSYERIFSSGSFKGGELPRESAVLSASIDERHNDKCHAVILNNAYDYHYEVLESIMALVPLPQNPRCDEKKTLHFTFAISDGEAKDFSLERSLGWYEYATRFMAKLEYATMLGRNGRKQKRLVHDVIRNSTYAPDDKNIKFDYQIRATCYCNTDDIQWLYDHESHVCVFHEKCEIDVGAHSRAVWVNPDQKPTLFPKFLPQFDDPRPIDPSTHHFCVIGNARRREYRLLQHYLKITTSRSNPQGPAVPGVHFHHFGMGNITKPMEEFAHLVTLHEKPNYVDYQYDLYKTCDAILSLNTKSRHPEYFRGLGPTKLSGCIVQAVSYGKPIVLHADLAEMYIDHLLTNHIETHGDSSESFAVAFHRLRLELDKIKRGEKGWVVSLGARR